MKILSPLTASLVLYLGIVSSAAAQNPPAMSFVRTHAEGSCNDVGRNVKIYLKNSNTAHDIRATILVSASGGTKISRQFVALAGEDKPIGCFDDVRITGAVYLN